jgi:hypothetical protein
MTPFAATGEVVRGDVRQRIERVGADLRSTLTAVLEVVAGPMPRPRASPASPAWTEPSSRLVRAVQSTSDRS